MCLILAGVALSVSNASAATLKTLYNFGNAPDGSAPIGSLIMDASGNLYGTTQSGGTQSQGGTVFRLTPPGPGRAKWTETVLHSFGAPGDGNYLQTTLVLDQGGSLYGTTFMGGANNRGTVFRLSPPVPGETQWTETILHSFSDLDYSNGNGGRNSDGAYPYSGALVFDTAGNLYGTAYNGGLGGPPCVNQPGTSGDAAGAVFRLSPPAAGQSEWTATVIHSFTNGCGNPNESELSGLRAGLVIAPTGDLYGTAIQGGSGAGDYGGVFQLSPPGPGQSEWTYSILHIFHDTNNNDCAEPVSAPTIGPDGALYALTAAGGRFNGGAICRLTPPSAGSTGWAESLLHSFKSGTGFYINGLAIDQSGALYGTTVTGGSGHEGSVFKLSPPIAGVSWAFANLASFQYVNGTFPRGGQLYASPLVVPGPVIFGTTASGGKAPSSAGTAFMITP